MADQVLGWGVIGIGNIVRSTMAPAMVAEPGCDLVAAVSRDQGRADAFAREFEARFAYTDYGEMLANSEVEAVFIATPNVFHAGQVIAAASAGKHVLCDKPLANNVADAEAALKACTEAGVALGVNFHNRQLPWVKDVSRLIADGIIGRVEMVQMQVASGPRHYDNWRADPEMAGLGSVHNVGVHGLDFLRVLLGSDPIEVLAMFDVAPGSGAVEMLALIQLRFGNGAMVQYNANERLRNPLNDIVIYGTEGRIVGRSFTRSRSDGELAVLTESGETFTRYPAPEAHRLSLAAFTSAVLHGEEPNASGLDGLRSAQICEAIDRSAREGRLVEVAY
ncbi:MAG TPA: Gfo/Idh/MocA family oxidoreductase [Acidimicrobiia bacterium]|nr:Gfo/Idh/MocA family oxidoreductase [Acidimicrobiia bacterium]